MTMSLWRLWHCTGYQFVNV